MSGIPLHWAPICAGFSLYFAGSPDATMDDVRMAASDAAGRWHNASCDPSGMSMPWFQMMPLPDTSTPTRYDPHGPNSNTVSFNSEWANQNDSVHRDGTIAVTLVTFDSSNGNILDADVEMNELSADNPDGFHFTVGTPDMQSADLPTILTHEFGHFQGLGHSVDMNAVMWPEAGLGEQRRMLTDDDIQGICTIYDPTIPPTDRLCNPVPFGGFADTPSGARARGGCSVPNDVGGSRGAALALVAACLALSRRGARAGRSRAGRAR
jgi:hypothetical protein